MLGRVFVCVTIPHARKVAIHNDQKFMILCVYVGCASVAKAADVDTVPAAAQSDGIIRRDPPSVSHAVSAGMGVPEKGAILWHEVGEDFAQIMAARHGEKTVC